MTGPARVEWKLSSIGNNLLTPGRGLRAPLGELRSHYGGTSVTVQFLRKDGRLVEHSARLNDVHPAALLPYARAVHALVTRDPSPEMKRIQAINLGAHGKKSAYVNELGRVVRSGLIAVVRWPLRALGKPEASSPLAEIARDTLIGELLRRHEGCAESGKSVIVLQGNDGRSLGRAEMTIRGPSGAQE